MKKQILATKNKTLYISIFYSEKDWHALLRKAIFPFLRGAKVNYEFNYIINLNKERGDNIGLTININPLLADNFLSQFNIFFNNFLHNYPSVFKFEYTSDVPLFMNFPNNSIQYGIHKFCPKFKDEYDRQLTNLLEQSSFVFFKELSKTTFDVEDACSIVIYFNIALLLTNPFLIEVYKKDISLEFQNHQMLSEFENRYQTNKELLSEIFQDCFRALKLTTIKPELRWLIKITGKFNAFISAVITFYKQRNARIEIDLFRVILLVSRNQLGMNLKGSLFIDYTLHRVLDFQYQNLP